MTYVSEVLFVDPSVDDIETILRNLRPGVEARILDPYAPAAQQIALALEGRDGLDALHVIAHGAPGRVNFSSGEWSLATLEQEAENLSAIGRALAANGNLRLWSCETAAGETGTVFIARLAEATGVDVYSANGLVGNAALGGSWKLTTSARPPLTTAGITGYAAVLANRTWIGTNGNWGSASNWNGGATVPATGDNVVLNWTGASDTITLNVSTNNLDSLTINDTNSSFGGHTPSNANLNVGAFNLNVTDTASGGSAAITINAGSNSNASISLAGGNIDAGTITITNGPAVDLTT